MKKLYIDFETLSECNIKACGADVYARHHTTSPICMAYAFSGTTPAIWIPESEVIRAGAWQAIDGIQYPVVYQLPHEVLAHVEAGGVVVAHNFNFDMQIWNHQTMFPRLSQEQMSCTSARASSMALPSSLGKLGDAMSITMPKNPMGTRLINQMSKPPFKTSPELLSNMVEYCARDVEAMMEIEERLMELSPSEWEVWQINQTINQRGLNLDTELIASAKWVSAEEDKRLIELAESLYGLSGTALRSPKQMLEFCETRGVHLENLSKATLASATIDHPEVKDALAIRAQVCRSSIKKFDAMENCMCPDGRARGSHVYHRATTGRFAGSGIQIQNLPRPVLDDPDGVADHLVAHGTLPTGLTHDVKTSLTSLLRSCIIPAEGKEFYGADFSSIESRVLFWLAGDAKGLSVYEKGEDLYCVTAEGIFRKPINKKDHPLERSIGKIAVLACGYGGGVKAYQGMCDSMGVDLEGRDPQEIVKGYRDTYEKTVQYWYSCEEGAVEALNHPGRVVKVGLVRFKYSPTKQALACQLPSGRLIQWPFPEVVKAETPWGAVKDQIQYKGVVPQSYKWSTMRTYGGDIAQSITQATARDFLTDAILRVEAAGFPIVLHVHDEMVAEVPVGLNKYEEFETLMVQSPSWGVGCPVKAEGSILRRYAK